MELYTCFLKQCAPSETGAGVLVGRIQIILLHVCLPEGVKDICQEEHICAEVEVMIVPQIGTLKGLPDLLCIGVVITRNMFVRRV